MGQIQQVTDFPKSPPGTPKKNKWKKKKKRQKAKLPNSISEGKRVT